MPLQSSPNKLNNIQPLNFHPTNPAPVVQIRDSMLAPLDTFEEIDEDDPHALIEQLDQMIKIESEK